jgi:hypothetical protein
MYGSDTRSPLVSARGSRGAFLEEERASLPRRIYHQEYECSFEETEDQVFSFEDIELMGDPTIRPLFEEAS